MERACSFYFEFGLLLEKQKEANVTVGEAKYSGSVGRVLSATNALRAQGVG